MCASVIGYTVTPTSRRHTTVTVAAPSCLLYTFLIVSVKHSVQILFSFFSFSFFLLISPANSVDLTTGIELERLMLCIGIEIKLNACGLRHLERNAPAESCVGSSLLIHPSNTASCIVSVHATVAGRPRYRYQKYRRFFP